MKKIMFNDKYGLTQAVLEGRKTMTRRTIPQGMIDKYYEWHADVSSIDFANIGMPLHIQTLQEAMILKAKYEVGDVIAIAQAYKDVNCAGYPVDSRYDLFRTAYSAGCVKESNGGWNNKMFVKAGEMPHHIKITDIKVERLQDISDEDILREGVLQSADGYDCYTFDGWVKHTKGKELPTQIYTKNRREAFATLIDKVSGKGTWEKNPWVFVYEFDLID